MLRCKLLVSGSHRQGLSCLDETTRSLGISFKIHFFTPRVSLLRGKTLMGRYLRLWTRLRRPQILYGDWVGGAQDLGALGLEPLSGTLIVAGRGMRHRGGGNRVPVFVFPEINPMHRIPIPHLGVGSRLIGAAKPVSERAACGENCRQRRAVAVWRRCYSRETGKPELELACLRDSRGSLSSRRRGRA